MKKRIITAIMSMSLVFSIMPMSAVSANDDELEYRTETVTEDMKDDIEDGVDDMETRDDLPTPMNESLPSPTMEAEVNPATGVSFLGRLF